MEAFTTYTAKIVDPITVDEMAALMERFRPEDRVVKLIVNRKHYDQIMSHTSPSDTPSLLQVVCCEWIPEQRLMWEYADGTIDIMNLEDGSVSRRARGLTPPR